MSTKSIQQRKAWNEAMRTTAGTAALPPALQTTHRKRRSDRHNNTNNNNNNNTSNSANSKQGRRDRARKTINQEDSDEYRAAAWMDALEDVPATATLDGADGAVDEDDSYDELEELEEEEKRTSSSNKNKRKRKSTTPAATKAAGKASAISMPKRFKPRTLASILLEEINRDDGVAHAWLENEARIQRNKQGQHATPPPRKFCPVTGMVGIYIDPKTRIPYANLLALEQIRERPPPWMTLGGNVAYHEAVKSIRDEEV
jgi:hypothetical protein